MRKMSFGKKDEQRYQKQQDDSVVNANIDITDITDNIDQTGPSIIGNHKRTASLSSTMTEDITEEIYSYQVKTRRFAIVLVLLGLILLLSGYSALTYDLIESKRAIDTSRYVFTIRPEQNDQSQNDKEQYGGLSFEFNKMTYALLQGLSLLMNSLTLIEGGLILYISLKTIFTIQSLINKGNGQFKQMQQKTRNIFDTVFLFAFIQASSSLVFSAVLIYIVEKADNKFQKQNDTYDIQQSQEDQKSILQFEHAMFIRCSLTIIFFTLGCLFNVMVLRSFKNYQKRYEDLIMDKVHDSSQLGISVKGNAIGEY
ncbi:UNKNOWN [Stylonychia lemnae]|uniref:Transmembrane protein n=1 Tax=Stylonychia lemnae TaxID=5949 RepID=A0A078A4E5_STYLE|nr:UNKNOWN [Stylonychia lemnae]|eukprot:CDW75639.1 UNKNOWN [Stylonychia lemnae]